MRNILNAIAEAVAPSPTTQRFFSPSVIPPAPPITMPTPEEFNSPSWRIVGCLLKFAGLPDAATIKQLNELSKQWLAALKDLRGLSPEDAKSEWVDAVLKSTRGELNPREIPTREELRRRNVNCRMIIRRKAQLISRQGAEFASDVLEAAISHIPAFEKQLVEQSVALGDSDATVRIRRMCKTLGPHLQKLAANMRHNSLSDPGQILKF